VQKLLATLGFPSPLLRLRRSLGLTQRELGELLKVSQGRIAQIESPEAAAEPTATWRDKLLALLRDHDRDRVDAVRQAILEKLPQGAAAFIDEELRECTHGFVHAADIAHVGERAAGEASETSIERDDLADLLAPLREPSFVRRHVQRLAAEKGIACLDANIPHAALLGAARDKASGDEVVLDSALYGRWSGKEAPLYLAPHSALVAGRLDGAPLSAVFAAAAARFFGIDLDAAISSRRKVPLLGSRAFVGLQLDDTWHRPQEDFDHARGQHQVIDFGIIARCAAGPLFCRCAEPLFPEIKTVHLAFGTGDLAALVGVRVLENAALLERLRGNRRDEGFAVAFRVEVAFGGPAAGSPTVVDLTPVGYWPRNGSIDANGGPPAARPPNAVRPPQPSTSRARSRPVSEAAPPLESARMRRSGTRPRRPVPA